MGNLYLIIYFKYCLNAYLSELMKSIYFFNKFKAFMFVFICEFFLFLVILYIMLASYFLERIMLAFE